jgi:hypothetical protein
LIPRSRTSRGHKLLILCAGVGTAFASSCLGVLGVTGVPELADAGTDAAGAFTRDAGSDVSVDALADVLATPPDGGPIYSAIGDTSKWSVFDVTTVGSPGNFLGGVFDGRYLELVPASSDVITRYDTLAPFTASPSWLTFDGSALLDAASGEGFAGAAFDSRYVYLAPAGNESVVLRYDIQGSFTMSAAWTTFDMSAANPKAQGFSGAVFAGQYVYFVPYVGFGFFDGLVGRYDVKGDFTSAASWSTFDVSGVNGGAKGFHGGTYDGRYLYLAPFANFAFGFDGTVPRYDTLASFDAATSWDTFDLTTINSTVKGFAGAVSAGSYVYLCPNYDGTHNDAIVARYDPSQLLTASSAWSLFDIFGVNAKAGGFFGGAFDGRYVYFVPATGLSTLARYDTQGTFTDAAAWSTFDVSTLNAQVSGFQGAAFDGEYLYLLPNGNGLVLRFDARTPPAVPAGFTGSFY